MKEIRLNNNISTDSRKVSGYAVVFNSLSEDLGGFREIILPSAITQETINNSDIIFLLDHKQDRGILARSTKGEGSLRLSVDDKGLYFEFDAPNTALGDELLEGLKRHDYSKCSFAFTVGEDEYKKDNGGTVIRTIKSIRQLYDCSVVVNPAYEETSVTVDERGLQKFLEDNNSNIDINNMAKISKRAKRSNEEILEEIKSLMAEMEESEECVEEVEEEVKDTDTTDETTDNSDKEKEEVIEDKNCDTDKPEDREDTEEEKVSEEVEDKEDVVENTTEDKEEINNENRNNTSMKFSLIKTINDVVNNRGLDEAAKAVNREGRSAMNKAGLACNGNITIPIEHREEPVSGTTNGILATVATQGKENVATDKLNILEPLRANMVMAQAGATYLTGLVGDVSIPVYSKSNVAWKGEVVAADNGEGAFSEVVLQPKRLTAFVDVSKQFLIQDSNDAEEMLKRDLIAAIGEKLEATILGAEAGDTTKPAGIFNGITADTAAFKFDNVVDMEASLEEENVNDYCYIVSPSAKAILRKTSKDTGSGQFVMADGEIEGRKVYVSSNVVKKGVVVGDYSDYVIAQYGAIDLTVDPYTKASEGMVRLVINAYFDAKPRRATSFVKRILK